MLVIHSSPDIPSAGINLVFAPVELPALARLTDAPRQLLIAHVLDDIPHSQLDRPWNRVLAQAVRAHGAVRYANGAGHLDLRKALVGELAAKFGFVHAASIGKVRLGCQDL